MALRPAMLPKNKNGGYYSPGRTYDLTKKLEVYDIYCKMADESFPEKPSVRRLAERARVGTTFAHQIIKECDEYGGVLDPKDIQQHIKDQKEGRTEGVGLHSLSSEHEVFLLSLLCENPARPLHDYANKLFTTYGVCVSIPTISNFWLHRFSRRGAFRMI